MFISRHCIDQWFCSHPNNGANLCQNLLETHELPSKAIPSNRIIPRDLAQDYNYSARKQQGSAPLQWHGKGQRKGPGAAVAWSG